MTRPTRPAATPLRGRYLVRNPLWNAWLHASDYVLSALRSSNGEGIATRAATPAPRRILIAIGGHLGDAVIASALLSNVSRAFPGAEIGVLCGSWSRRVLESHPRVRWTHVVDHWKLHRGGGSLFSRWLTTRRTRARAIAELRGVGYDAAIDLAAYYPNSSRLLWRAGIPIRVGYTSGGDGPLYTHPVAWSARSHVAEEHAVLLTQLAPTLAPVAPRYDLPPVPVDTVTRVRRRLSHAGLSAGTYVVVHMGAGDARKEWRIDHWIALVRELAASGSRTALTGAGAKQRALARQVVDSAPGSVDFTDQLDWNEFRAVIAAARMTFSVDTVAMHLAGAAGTPCVALMTGMDVPARWRPLGAGSILSEHVPCAPCFRSRGCADMSCIRDITTESVLAAARPYLGS